MPTVPATVSPGQVITAAHTNTLRTAIVEMQAGKVDLTGETMTGQLILPANAGTTNALAAIHRTYGDTRWLGLASGGEIEAAVTINTPATSQCLVLKSQVQSGGSYVNTPYLAFYNNASTRYGFVQGTASYLNITSDTGDVRLNSGGGQVRTSDAVYTSGGSNRFFGTATNLVGTGFACNLSIYGAGSNVDSIGTRSAIIGYTGDNQLHLWNQVTSASTFISAANAIVFRNGSTTAPVEVARIDGTVFLLGKTASSAAIGGVELLGATGQILATVETNVPNLIVNRTGTGDVDNGLFTSYRHNNTEVGKIHWDSGTSHVVYAQTSDYRLKNDLGPVTDGLERIRLLNPRRVTRKDSPAPVEHDALIAHEVADVIPNVVSGDKDAVAPAPPAGEPPENYPPQGSIVPQSLDYTGLISTLVAAIKDLADQNDALTARIDALEAGLMATRLIGTDSADPKLPDVVIAATQGTTAADLAPGDVIADADTYTDDAAAATLNEAKDYTDATLARTPGAFYARWPLDDEVGTVAGEMGGRYNGTYVGGPIMSDTDVTFVGDASKYVSLPILDYGSRLAGSTIEFWLKTSQSDGGIVFGVVNTVDSMLLQLLLNGSTTSAPSTAPEAAQRSVFRIRSASIGTAVGSGTHWWTPDIPYDGAWHHVIIAVSDDPINTTIFVDGVQAEVVQSGAAPSALDLTDFDTPVTVGGRNFGGVVTVPYAGSIKGLTIRPYAVNTAQAEEIYTTASGEDPETHEELVVVDPARAVSYQNKLFVMGSWGIDVGLDIHNVSGEHTVYRLARMPEFEDHNNGAVLIRTGKPMVTMWCRHAQDSIVRYRVGAVNVEDAETRQDYLGTAEYTYTTTNAVTYQVAMDIAGTIWVFNRIGPAGSWRWNVRKSTAWSTSGVTWAAAQNYLTSTDNKQFYTAAVPVGTATIRTACSNHPVNGSGMQGIYYGEINTATGAVTGAAGASLGTLGTAIPHASLQTVYVPPAGQSVWIYDVGDHATIRELTFVQFDPANRDTTAVYKYARWSGSAWVITDIVAAGKRFTASAPSDTEPYYGSVHIRRGTAGGVVYLTREASGTWYVERRTSADSGATWTPTVLASFVEQPRQNLVRVFPVEGDGTHPAELVYVHTYRWSTYTSYRSDFVIIP